MNYYEYKSNLSIRTKFFYIDCTKYLADDIFIANNVKVKYKKELFYSDTDYKVIFVSVPKLNDYLFIKSMDELCDKMLERGYTDYEEICEEIISKINQPKKKVKKCIN